MKPNNLYFDDYLAIFAVVAYFFVMTFYPGTLSGTSNFFLGIGLGWLASRFTENQRKNRD